MTRATTRIELRDYAMAEQLKKLLEPYDVYAWQQETDLFVDDLALEVLGELDEEHDGHYDGHHVWVGGCAYDVY
jgi:hypothetical protein